MSFPLVCINLTGGQKSESGPGAWSADFSGRKAGRRETCRVRCVTAGARGIRASWGKAEQRNTLRCPSFWDASEKGRILPKSCSLAIHPSIHLGSSQTSVSGLQDWRGVLGRETPQCLRCQRPPSHRRSLTQVAYLTNTNYCGCLPVTTPPPQQSHSQTHKGRSTSRWNREWTARVQNPNL